MLYRLLCWILTKSSLNSFSCSTSTGHTGISVAKTTVDKLLKGYDIRLRPDFGGTHDSLLEMWNRISLPVTVEKVTYLEYSDKHYHWLMQYVYNHAMQCMLLVVSCQDLMLKWQYEGRHFLETAVTSNGLMASISRLGSTERKYGTVWDGKALCALASCMPQIPTAPCKKKVVLVQFSQRLSTQF